MTHSLLMHYSVVIFDLDGTLYNNRFLPLHLIEANPSKALWMLAERIVRKRLAGKEFASQQDLLNVQYSMIASLVHSTAEKVKQWFEMSYLPLMAKTIGKRHKVNKDVLSLVGYYRSHGSKLVLFSDYGHTREKLNALGIDENSFDIIVDGPMLGGLKPCKRSFERVLELADAKAENALMFGDRDDTDGIGCSLTGIEFVNVKKTDINQFLELLN